MKPEIRSQRTEVSPQDALRQSQKPEIRTLPAGRQGQNLFSVLCRLSSVVCLLAMLLANTGCELFPGLTAKTSNDVKELSVYSRFAPAKINIMPLTEFISAGDTQQPNINLYVSLLDSFGSQIKSPAVFRFELYQRVLRSAEPKRRRVVIWPDIDLTDPDANNEDWRDFLRAYEFDLPLEPDPSQSYILQVTCLCPNGRRISAEFALKLTK